MTGFVVYWFDGFWIFLVGFFWGRMIGEVITVVVSFDVIFVMRVIFLDNEGILVI